MAHPLLTWRLPCFYVLSFSILGSVVPFLASTLLERDIHGWVLAAAVGALPLGRLIAGPLWSLWTDRSQRPGAVLVAGSIISMLGLVWLRETEAWWTALAVFVLSIGRAPLGPVIDAIALSALGDDKGRYGRLRLWGSLGFMMGSIGSGLAWKYGGTSPLDMAIILNIPLVFLCLEMPLGKGVGGAKILPALRALIRDRLLLWLLVAAALHFASHVGSTSFLAVHLDALGYEKDWTGWIIAMGITVEVLVMSQAKFIFDRFPARTVFLAALVVALPRWLLTAMVDNVWWLLLLQGGHGFTFGAFWLAGVSLMSTRAPNGVETSAQGLFAAAVGGIGAMIGMVGASLVVEHSTTRHLFWWGAGASVFAIFCALMALRSRNSDGASRRGDCRTHTPLR